MKLTRGKLPVYVMFVIWTIQTIRFFLLDGMNNKEIGNVFAFFSTLYVVVLVIILVVFGLVWIIINWDKPIIKKK